MNILASRVVLRDRTVVDVVDLALRFLMSHGAIFARVAAIVLPPWFLLTWWIAAQAGWGFAWTAAVLTAPFASAPFTALASRLVFEPQIRVREVLGACVTALPRLVAVRVVEGIGAVFSLTAFILPVLYTLGLFVFANEVVVLERASVGGALARMQRLAVGSRGDAILAVLFLLALTIVAVFLGDLVGRGILEDVLEIAPPPSIFETKGSVLGLAAFWAFVPFGATCRFLLYLNVRTRNEGWDVQTRFAAIAARVAGA